MTPDRPAPSWPIAARPELVDQVAQRLRARPSRAQLIVGVAGIGKTTFARAVLSRLREDGRTVVPIVGVAELRGVPAAALAPVLATAPVAEREATAPASPAGPADVGDRVHRFVAAVGAAGSRYVLAVDDISLVDDVTAGVVYQLIRVFGVPALLTDRAERGLAPSVSRLDAEGLVDRVPLPPLTTAQISGLAEAYLGGPLHPDAARRLARVSDGNPLVLREVVMRAEREGRFVSGPIGFHLDAAQLDAVRLAPQLLDTLTTPLADLTTAERHLADLLALSQPWPEELASRTDATALRTLIQRAIVTVTSVEGRRRVRLAHPLLAEALLGGLDADRRNVLVREAADALRSTGDPDDRRTAIHILPEADVAAAELEWAAQAAASAGDPETALRLATAAERADPTCRTALIRAVALSALDDDPEAAFHAAAARAADDLERATVTLRHGQHLAYRRRDPRAAAALAADTLARISREAGAALEAEVVKWRAMAGEVTAYEPFPGASSLADLGGALTEAMFATMGGHISQAQSAIDRGVPLTPLHRAELPHAGSLLALSQFLVHVGSGRIDRAQALAEEQRVGGEPDAAGLWAYTLALIALHGGRHDEALDLSRLALRLLEWRDFTGLVDAARALERTCAIASGAEPVTSTGDASTGDTSTGDASTGDTSTDDRLTDVKAVLQHAEAEAWAAAVAGRAADADAVLREAVEEGLRQRHHVLAALTASTALRLGRTHEVVDLLERTAGASGAPLCTLLADAAAARSRGDYARCVELLPALRRAGVAGVARRLAEDAARNSTPGPTRTQARIAFAELASLTSADPLRGAAAPDDEAALSPREWQIARLAAARRRSREIADALGLSVRTVDNHLARVYRKLDVSGRDELAEILDVLGELDPDGGTTTPSASPSTTR